MGAFTQKIKPYVLPIALVLGALFHNLCGQIAFLTPYIVFTILLLTFAAVEITKLRLSWLDLWLALFQMTVSIGGYYLLVTLGVNYIIAQGLLIGVLCPVAASVAVISCMMGADRRTVTTYTIVGNLMVAVVAPLYFTIVTHTGNNGAQEVTFFASFWMILKKIGPTIGFPFFCCRSFFQRSTTQWHATKGSVSTYGPARCSSTSDKPSTSFSSTAKATGT